MQQRRTLPLALVAAVPTLLFCIVMAIKVSEYPDWWIFSGSCSVFLITIGLLILTSGGRVLLRAAAFCILLGTLLVQIAEAATYYIQGTGFSEEFFNHLLLPGGYRGLAAYPIAVGLIVLILSFSAAVYWKVLSAGRKLWVIGGVSRITLIAAGSALVAGLAMSPWPRLIQAWNAFSVLTSKGDGGTDAFNVPSVSKQELVATPSKNLVIIYLESFDSVYLDEAVFPELAPNLNLQAKESLHYSGMKNYPGIGYTMSGIFSSQCGVPLTLGMPGRLEETTNNISRSQYRPALVCLGDVLRSAGYKQVFMGGADADFAGKSNFFKLHGYDDVLGLSDWQRNGSAAGHVSNWGLYDAKLIDLAVAKFNELASSRQPFNLTLLTLDTHGPDGAASPSCKPYENSDNSLLDAVHCTDQLVASFLGRIKSHPAYENTVVVVMGDHASMRNIAHDLYPKSYERTPVLMVINAGRGRHDARIYHMDVAPTILSLMGVESNAEFIAGWAQRDSRQRVGAALSGSGQERRQLAESLYRDQPDIELCRHGALISWNAAGKVEVGGLVVSPRQSGYRMNALPAGAGALVRISRTSASYFVVDEPHEHPNLVDGELGIGIEPVDAVGDKPSGYSLTAYNALGGKLRLADYVESLKSISLTSKECKSVEHRMRTSKQVEDMQSLIAVISNVAPVRSDGRIVRIAKDSPVEWFVSGWGEPTDGGIWGVGSESRMLIATDAKVCHGGKVAFHIVPYVSPARPRLSVKIYPAYKPDAVQTVDFSFVESEGATLELSAQGVDSGQGGCLLSYVFETKREINNSAKENATDAWPITFSLESLRVRAP